ncbi:MAG TPA: hypothetical protein ENN33_08490 [Ignavibacteria bacterium]|nr:hypothetical protein [Ignavibacteria bacterium]
MRLFKRSNGIFYIKIFDDFGNEIKRISTGEKRKSSALKKLASLKERLRDEKRTKPTSLGTFRKNYLQFVDTTKSAGYKNSVRSAFRFLATVFEDDTRLTDINPQTVETSLLELSEKSPHSAYTFHKIISSAMNRAVQLGFLYENPFTRIKIPKPARKENVYIDQIEFEKILVNEPSQILRDIYIFAYNTGMRLSEITNTRLSWIDMKELTITVQNSGSFRTKNMKSRIIPINEKTYEIIQKNIPKVISMNRDDYLFRQRGCRISGEYISKKFKKAARETFGEKTLIHFHNLRGSFGSELIKKGANPIHVQKLLGHSSFSVTERNYLSIQLIDLRKAVDKL